MQTPLLKTPLRPGEELVRHGMGNMRRGLESVGGKLYLTNQRIIFEPHAINVQTDCIAIELGQIARAVPAWTTFLGVPLAPNAVRVESHQGDKALFTVFNRKQWAGAIEWQKDALAGQG